MVGLFKMLPHFWSSELSKVCLCFIHAVRGHSASEGSGEGTGDEQLAVRKTKKKRSFKNKKKKNDEEGGASGVMDNCQPVSDSDMINLVGEYTLKLS